MNSLKFILKTQNSIKLQNQIYYEKKIFVFWIFFSLIYFSTHFIFFHKISPSVIAIIPDDLLNLWGHSICLLPIDYHVHHYSISWQHLFPPSWNFLSFFSLFSRLKKCKLLNKRMMNIYRLLCLHHFNPFKALWSNSSRTNDSIKRWLKIKCVG